jgi:transcriptional regulator with XRE-family HTH domain
MDIISAMVNERLMILFRYERERREIATMLTVATLAERLRGARWRAMLTQHELAEESGVGVATIRRIEGGEILEPRFSTLRKLARALDVEPRALHPDED